METKPQLIFSKIAAVMAEIDAIGKQQRNSQQGYNFRGVDDVYNELHPLFSKHKIFTATEVLDHQREERPTKSGGLMTYSLMKIKFTFFAEDGSSFNCVMIGEGSDSGDKSSNKAMAVAHKYALVQVFAIPTKDDKDPENHSPEFKSKTAAAVPSEKKQDAPKPAPTTPPPSSTPASFNAPPAAPPVLPVGESFVIPSGTQKGKKLRQFELKDLEGMLWKLEGLENPNADVKDLIRNIHIVVDTRLRRERETKK